MAPKELKQIKNILPQSNFEWGFCMDMGDNPIFFYFEFWQSCLLDSELLASGKSFRTFKVDF